MKGLSGGGGGVQVVNCEEVVERVWREVSGIKQYLGLKG